MLPRVGIEWGSLLTIRNGVVLVLDAPISAMRGKEGKNNYKLFFFSVVSHCFIITIIIIIMMHPFLCPKSCSSNHSLACTNQTSDSRTKTSQREPKTFTYWTETYEAGQRKTTACSADNQRQREDDGEPNSPVSLLRVPVNSSLNF